MVWHAVKVPQRTCRHGEPGSRKSHGALRARKRGGKATHDSACGTRKESVSMKSVKEPWGSLSSNKRRQGNEVSSPRHRACEIRRQCPEGVSSLNQHNQTAQKKSMWQASLNTGDRHQQGALHLHRRPCSPAGLDGPESGPFVSPPLRWYLATHLLLRRGTSGWSGLSARCGCHA